MDFSKVKYLEVPNSKGETKQVSKITDSMGRVLWEQPGYIMLLNESFELVEDYYIPNWTYWLNNYNHSYTTASDGAIYNISNPRMFLCQVIEEREVVPYAFANVTHTQEQFSHRGYMPVEFRMYANNMNSAWEPPKEMVFNWTNMLYAYGQALKQLTDSNLKNSFAYHTIDVTNTNGSYTIDLGSGGDIAGPWTFNSNNAVEEFEYWIYHTDSFLAEGNNKFTLKTYGLQAFNAFIPEISVEIIKLPQLVDINVGSFYIEVRDPAVIDGATIHWSSKLTGNSGTVITHQESGGRHILDGAPIIQHDVITIQMTKTGCLASTTQVINI